ncbi:ferritin-like domain-containing protein [soil metagenome]
MTYLDALQDTLAAEHAALFVVGYLGAQTSASAQPDLYGELSSAYEVHRSLRDELVDRVRQAGGEPVAAAASYELDDVAGDPTRIRRRALALERACSAAYGFLVANSPGAERRFAVDVLIETALRELALGGRPRVLPGR